MAYDATVRNLEIIGEAANRLSDNARAAAPEIPWDKIAGFRNIAVHEYFRLDRSIVEGLISNYLPTLRTAIEKIRDGG
jgi:uncharacterized protein with HEPN domain